MVLTFIGHYFVTMNHIRLSTRILALALVWLIWTGCGSDDGDSATVFRYNESANLSSLDPAQARTLEPMWVIDQIFDGLVELDADLKIRPLIAESYEVSATGLEWTFHLREDVFFHSDGRVPGLERGRQLVANDVLYSLNRLRDPLTASSGAWILENLDEQAEGQGMTAPDDVTVRFVLKRPFAAFLGLLSTAYANVVPREAVEFYGPDFRSHPVGSGPFRLAWWLEDVACVLHRNDSYWQQDESGMALPYLEAVHISFASDMGTEFQGLLQGRFDFMSGLHPSYMNELLTESGALREEYAAELKLETVPFLKTDYIGFYIGEGVADDGAESAPGIWEPWKDQAVRKALSWAIDRQQLAITLRRGTVLPTAHFVPPALLGNTKVSPWLFDRQQARKMLDSVEVIHPKPWPALTISTTSDYTDLCAALQYQWQMLGLEVEIDVVSASTHRDRVSSGKAFVFRKSWLADYPDAENFLALFSTANFSPAGPNYSHFSNVEFDEVFAQASGTTDETSRLALYRQLDQQIAEDLPVIPLFHDQVTHFVRKEVVGWEVSPINRLDLKRIRKQMSTSR